MSYNAISGLVQSHLLAISLVAVLLLVAWVFNHNEDLQPHRVPLAMAFGLLGIIPPPTQDPPSLRLFQAWWANGFTRKAYRAAHQNLVKTEDAFPIWLFAAETAAIHFWKVPTAIKIMRRLCLTKQFTDDQNPRIC